MTKQEKPIHTLIPYEDFKALLGIDDREEKLARFCLATATYTIEQHCKRRFLHKKHFERIQYIGDNFLPLGEYPVNDVLAVYALIGTDSEIIESDFYSVIPYCGTFDDIPFYLSFSRALQRYRGLFAVKVVYWAGYSVGNIPPDLASACMELAVWNMNRYKGRRIGMTGNVRGGGKDGEHFELSMPENVRTLLEPYRRKTI
jgi:hypothetical protein